MLYLSRILTICIITLSLATLGTAQATVEKEDVEEIESKETVAKEKDKSVDKKSDKSSNKDKDKAKDEVKDQVEVEVEVEDKEDKEDKAPTEKKLQLRQISLSGNYVDLVQPLRLDPLSLAMGTSPSKQRSFYKLCKFIDDLAKDDRFTYVVFDLSAGRLFMNSAQLDELTRHIKKLTDAGKKTYAWLENASSVHLSIASSCDEVIIADFGGIDMPSMAMQSMFFRDAMDLIGVKASVVRAGDFKGAVEPYVNSKMSTHLREHYMEMLTSMNDAQIDRIARGRGLKHAEIRELQAKRILLPKEALAAGLVDGLAPYGTMQKTIVDEIDEPIEWVTAKAAAKKQMSLFQLMGQLMAGPQGASGRLRNDSIAVLHLFGPIVDGKKSVVGNIVSGPTVELIEKLTEEEKFKGVVVRINSPGGSATASEAVRQALTKLAKEKPTVVSMGDIAASGGYWISCIDAPVFAESGTLTGSIGVFSLKISAGALMRRVGVHMESIILDESAGAFSLDRPWTEQDNETLQGTIDMVYDRFLALVSDSRGIKLKKLRKLAGGRVWSGEQAKKLKLVDHLGGVDDCLAVVAKKAKLDDFHVVHRPVPRSGLDLSELFGSGREEEIWADVSTTALRILQQRGLSLKLTRMLISDAIGRNGRPTTWLLNPMQFSIR